MAKSNKERKQKQREFDKKNHIRQMNIDRVHDDDRDEIRDFAKRLLKDRLKLINRNMDNFEDEDFSD